MKFTASCAELSGLKTDSLILPTGSELSNSAKVVNELTHNSIDSAIESGEFTGQIWTGTGIKPAPVTPSTNYPSGH